MLKSGCHCKGLSYAAAARPSLKAEMSTLVPKEVTQKGCLGNGSWLTGNVVRIRQRTVGGAPNSAAKSSKGKGKKQGNTNKESQTDGLEIHLCGGPTPADAINRVKSKATIGSTAKLTDIDLVQHSEKTTPWTTSRLPLYARFTSESKIEVAEPSANWLRYHPLTPLRWLQHVPGRMLHLRVGRA